MTTAVQKEMYSASEFAKALSVGRETVHGWMRNGWIKSVKVGPKLVRIPRSELERVLKEGFQPKDEIAQAACTRCEG